MAFVVFYIYQ